MFFVGVFMLIIVGFVIFVVVVFLMFDYFFIDFVEWFGKFWFIIMF